MVFRQAMQKTEVHASKALAVAGSAAALFDRRENIPHRAG